MLQLLQAVEAGSTSCSQLPTQHPHRRAEKHQGTILKVLADDMPRVRDLDLG